MKITLTIDADISAEEITTIMEKEAKLEKERQEWFTTKIPPPIFAEQTTNPKEVFIGDLTGKTKKDKPN